MHLLQAHMRDIFPTAAVAPITKSVNMLHGLVRAMLTIREHERDAIHHHRILYQASAPARVTHILDARMRRAHTNKRVTEEALR